MTENCILLGDKFNEHNTSLTYVSHPLPSLHSPLTHRSLNVYRSVEKGRHSGLGVVCAGRRQLGVCQSRLRLASFDAPAPTNTARVAVWSPLWCNLEKVASFRRGEGRGDRWHGSMAAGGLLRFGWKRITRNRLRIFYSNNTRKIGPILYFNYKTSC